MVKPIERISIGYLPECSLRGAAKAFRWTGLSRHTARDRTINRHPFNVIDAPHDHGGNNCACGLLSSHRQIVLHSLNTLTGHCCLQ
jgi:hypothetical protein